MLLISASLILCVETIFAIHVAPGKDMPEHHARELRKMLLSIVGRSSDVDGGSIVRYLTNATSYHAPDFAMLNVPSLDFNSLNKLVNQIADKKIADKKIADKKITDRKTADKKIADKKITDRKTADRKIADKKITDRKIADKKIVDKKIADNKIADKKITDRKTADKKIADKKIADKKIADKKIADKKTADNKIAEQKENQTSFRRKEPSRRYKSPHQAYSTNNELVQLTVNLIDQCIYATRFNLLRTKKFRKRYSKNYFYLLGTQYGSLMQMRMKLESLFSTMMRLNTRGPRRRSMHWFLLVYTKILATYNDIRFAVHRMFQFSSRITQLMNMGKSGEIVEDYDKPFVF